MHKVSNSSQIKLFKPWLIGIKETKVWQTSYEKNSKKEGAAIASLEYCMEEMTEDNKLGELSWLFPFVWSSASGFGFDQFNKFNND